MTEKYLTPEEAREIQLDTVLWFKPSSYSQKLILGKVIGREHNISYGIFEINFKMGNDLGIFDLIPYTDCQLP